MSTTRSKSDALGTVIRFTFRHWMRRRWLAFGVAGAMTLATLTEIFIPLFVGRLIDALGQGAAGREAAAVAFGAMTALGLAMVLLRHAASYGVMPLTLGIMRDVAVDAFERVQRFSTDWHANSFAGATVRKITRGMWALDAISDTMILALLPSLVVLIGTMLLLGAQWPVMGAVMAVGAILYVMLTVGLATRVIAPASRLSNAWDTRIGGLIADAVGTNAVVKAFGAEAREDWRLRSLLGKWSRRVERTWVRFTWSGTIQLALLWGVRTAVTGGALYLWWRGRATAGDVAYVLTTYLVVHGYLRDVGIHIQNMQRAVNEMEEMVALHDQPLGVDDPEKAMPIWVATGEIAFRDVHFHYPTHATPLFDGLSVTIPAGQRVGLVGPSGSGKTTFVKLLQRLYDINGGEILIDGQDIAATMQASLRQQIAIVPQEPILFHRSVGENIAYGRPDATADEIAEAARHANAAAFIARLPKGYRTPVGERGAKLSGGERQRIAIARAFLVDAPILILDEATAALDAESESLIQQAVDRLMRGRTALVIAHRLSTIRALDRILVFDQGRIVEDGDHAALMAIPGGVYRGLFERQAGGVALVEAE